MPAKNKVQISFWLTPEQYTALMTVAGDYGRSQFIRDAVGDCVEKNGVEWPDNMPEMGAALNPTKLGDENT